MIEKVRITDLYDTMLVHEDLLSFCAFLQKAGLHLAIRMLGPLTVLAFTNRAFDALPETTRTAMKTDRDLLTAVMMHHIVRGDLSVPQMQEKEYLKTVQSGLNGGRFGDGRIQIKDVDWTGIEISATNGTIHLVNQALIQPELEALAR